MNKMINLPEAAALVPDGATISFGGFTTQRHPMAFVYELVRLKRRNLYLFGHSPGGRLGYPDRRGLRQAGGAGVRGR